MKYEKPEAVAFSSALKVIESGSSSKPSTPYIDSSDSTKPHTNGAYEADE